MTGAPKEKPSDDLKVLNALEGGCNGNVQLFLERLGVPLEEMSQRQRSAYDVISQYRPARAKLRSEDPLVQEQGRAEMLAFACTRPALAQAAFAAGDFIGGLNILQTRASALGMAGDRDGQVAQLREIWTQLLRLQEDILFLQSSTKSGLLENDADFASGVNLDEHQAFVLMLHGRRDPNYPGRATVLARRLAEQGNLEEACAVLRKAVSIDFGKEEQIVDAQALLTELLGPSEG